MIIRKQKEKYRYATPLGDLKSKYGIITNNYHSPVGYWDLYLDTLRLRPGYLIGKAYASIKLPTNKFKDVEIIALRIFCAFHRLENDTIKRTRPPKKWRKNCI